MESTIEPSQWASYYTKKVSAETSFKAYLERKISTKTTFLSHVTGQTLVEAGCGSAVLSCHFALQGKNVIAIDQDASMIGLAKHWAQSISANVNFLQQDLTQLKLRSHVDCIFSNGVLEHFDDSTIISTLNQHVQQAKKVVFAIPSDFFNPAEAINGDERFLSTSHWLNLINRSQSKLIDRFNYGPSKDNKHAFEGFVICSE